MALSLSRSKSTLKSITFSMNKMEPYQQSSSIQTTIFRHKLTTSASFLFSYPNLIRLFYLASVICLLVICACVNVCYVTLCMYGGGTIGRNSICVMTVDKFSLCDLHKPPSIKLDITFDLDKIWFKLWWEYSQIVQRTICSFDNESVSWLFTES